MNEIYEGYTTSTTWGVRPVEKLSEDKRLRIKLIFDEFEKLMLNRSLRVKGLFDEFEEKILETFND